MIEIPLILCPVDFSETSQRALEHATAIAKWYGSRLIAFHVLQPSIVVRPPILFAEIASSVPQVTQREEVEARLRDWLRPATLAGVDVELTFDEGNPSSCIVDRAISLDASLIAMGTHGHTGFQRFVLGSVAERVLRRAACPVLTVPPSAVSAASVPYTRLMCAVDFSDSSLAALRYAFSIAEESDARLLILHVCDPGDDDYLAGRHDEFELRSVFEDNARRRLAALVTGDDRTWCKPTTHVVHGKAYRKILDTASHTGTDLIVIGVHGRNPLDIALFGSTTNQVIRRAPCPVLTLKTKTAGAFQAA